MRWVLVAVPGLCLAVGSQGLLSTCGAGASWGSSGSRQWASVVIVYGLPCPAARGIFLNQGLNLCPLRWQADS